MPVFDVLDRLTQLQQTMPELRLYALIDGAQYQTCRGEWLTSRAGMYALFMGTEDAALAHAGPWLVDTEQTGEAFTEDLIALEHEAPAVSWLISALTLDGLAQVLQLNLDVRLPDGRNALLRFWDPRVLVSLVELLNADQREAFFAHIYEWHLLNQGKRAWIGRHHAYSQ